MRFKERFVSEGAPDSIFAALNVLDRETLEPLKETLEELVAIYLGDKEALSVEQQNQLDVLFVSEQALSIFMEGCKDWFGASRILSEDEIEFQLDKFEGYEAFAKALAGNVGKYYFEILRAKLQDLIQEAQENNVHPVDVVEAEASQLPRRSQRLANR